MIPVDLPRTSCDQPQYSWTAISTSNESHVMKPMVRNSSNIVKDSCAQKAVLKLSQDHVIWLVTSGVVQSKEVYILLP